MQVTMTKTVENGQVVAAKMYTAATWANAQEAFAITAEELEAANAFRKEHNVVLMKVDELVIGEAKCIDYKAIPEQDFLDMVAGVSFTPEQIQEMAEK